MKAIDLEIKSAEIRGVLSEGMICSLQELGLEEVSKGIAIIEESLAKKYKLGHDAADILQLKDFIYDLAITANRPDGMSLIGIAREVSASLLPSDSVAWVEEPNAKISIDQAIKERVGLRYWKYTVSCFLI